MGKRKDRLKAVRDLHQPVLLPLRLFERVSLTYYCGECSHGRVRTPYPCRTVRASRGEWVSTRLGNIR